MKEEVKIEIDGPTRDEIFQMARVIGKQTLNYGAFMTMLRKKFDDCPICKAERKEE